MTRIEENRLTVESLAKIAECTTFKNHEESVDFQLASIFAMIADISKSLAILADKAEGSEKE